MKHLLGIALSIALGSSAFAQDSEEDPDSIGVLQSDGVVEDIEPEVPLLPEPAIERWDEADLDSMVAALFEAPSHGLPSLDHLAFRIANPQEELSTRQALAQQAFLQYGGWLRFDLIDQETLSVRELSNEQRNTIIMALDEALGGGDVTAALAGFTPRVRDYEILRREMLRMMALQPIWPEIETEGGALEPGATGARVEQLRARLSAEGLYRSDWEDGAPYGPRLETAVRRFQGRVNLAPSGRMDRNTLRQLNISPQDRLAQLRANLEQRRWRERDLGRKHIWVNIADYRLEAWEDGELVRTHEVMVGRTASSTPEFSDEMEYLVFNPWWGVPTGSARSRFRSIRRNPNVVDHYGFRIFDSAGSAIQPWEIDWSQWGRSWPYRLSQAPGPTNPMGEVKFIFPNRHNVYIHDTTERDQFVRTRRDFSAGCIRVEDPLELARWILAGQDGYDEGRISQVVQGNTPTVVWLDERIRVHIAYWTVVGDEDGGVRYLNDLYGRDTRLVAAYQDALESYQPTRSELVELQESLAIALE